MRVVAIGALVLALGAGCGGDETAAEETTSTILATELGEETEEWRGTIMQRGEIAHAGCSWTLEGPAEVVVAADGSLSGSARGVFTEVNGPCTGPIVGRKESFRLSGVKDEGGFRVETRGLSFDMVVSGQTARGRSEEAGIITWTLDLTCQSC